MTLVCVVDDDESVRESLPDLLRSHGMAAEAFASAEEFLSSGDLRRASCLILDVRMPGMSGPTLQRELARRRCAIPIIFVTAFADDDEQLALVQRGAVDCLAKPFSEATLLRALQTALAPDA